MPSYEAKLDLIRNSSNQDEIIDIALNDNDWHVRQLAVKHVEDESVLKSILNNDLSTNVAVTAMNRIDDEDFLIDTCLNNPFSHIRLAALNRICDEKLISDDDLKSLLSEVALNDPDDFICQTALTNPNFYDEGVLERIAESGRDVKIRCGAILKITDENVLKELALNSPDKFIRNAAIQNLNLNDADILTRIIRDDEDEFNRYWACEKINDENLFLTLIFDKSYYKCLKTLSENFNIATCDYFIDIYENSEDDYRRRVAAIFIDDGDYLEKIILNESVDKVRIEAVRNKNFTDEELLKRLISGEDNPDMISTAISRIGDSEFLKETALSRDSQTALEAVNCLDGDDDLIEVALNSSGRKIRLKSLSKVRPKSILNAYLTHAENGLDKIALNEGDDEIRCAAISKLTDKHVLDEIIRTDSEDSKIAQKRLNSLFEEIKLINRESVLKKLASVEDADISYVAFKQLEDLKTWKNRISEIENISDIDRLKDIAENDFNYLVRCEAEGRLEKILFNIRLDEIESAANQDKLRDIAGDEALPSGIRKRALDMIV